MFQAKFEAHSQALERIGELLLADLFRSFLETEPEIDGGAGASVGTAGTSGTDESEAKSDEVEPVVVDTVKKAEVLVEKFMKKSRIQYYYKRNVNMAAPYYDDLEENAIDIINRLGVYIFD